LTGRVIEELQLGQVLFENGYRRAAQQK